MESDKVAKTVIFLSKPSYIAYITKQYIKKNQSASLPIFVDQMFEVHHDIRVQVSVLLQQMYRFYRIYVESIHQSTFHCTLLVDVRVHLAFCLHQLEVSSMSLMGLVLSFSRDRVYYWLEHHLFSISVLVLGLLRKVLYFHYGILFQDNGFGWHVSAKRSGLSFAIPLCCLLLQGSWLKPSTLNLTSFKNVRIMELNRSIPITNPWIFQRSGHSWADLFGNIEHLVEVTCICSIFQASRNCLFELL